MKIVNDNPPHGLRETIASFGMQPHSGVIYTYGDTIYNPSGIDLPDHLIAHEETHSNQQSVYPVHESPEHLDQKELAKIPPRERISGHATLEKRIDAWWDRYLQDQYFRIEQETAAYARQYAYICATVRDRERRHKILLDLAKVLAGPVYGNVISTMDAYKKIKNLSKVKP